MAIRWPNLKLGAWSPANEIAVDLGTANTLIYVKGEGIVMTGGGALIRGLDVLLQQETGLPIHLDEDPMTCVVRGTGRILDDPEKYRNVLTT